MLLLFVEKPAEFHLSCLWSIWKRKWKKIEHCWCILWVIMNSFIWNYDLWMYEFFYLESWMLHWYICLWLCSAMLSRNTVYMFCCWRLGTHDETVCRSYTRCNMISGSQLRRASFIHHKLCSKWCEGCGRANRVSICGCVNWQEQELCCLGRHNCCPGWPGLVSLVKA